MSVSHSNSISATFYRVFYTLVRHGSYLTYVTGVAFFYFADDAVCHTMSSHIVVTYYIVRSPLDALSCHPICIHQARSCIVRHIDKHSLWCVRGAGPSYMEMCCVSLGSNYCIKHMPCMTYMLCMICFYVNNRGTSYNDREHDK